MRKIIAVDVDLTVVEMINSWVEWYYKKTGVKLEEFKSKTWNIEELMIHHNDPMEFWKNPNLYDEVSPIENSVEVLRELSEDYDIVFVSHCLPEHENSKRYFIKRNFPFAKGFISTGDKGFVKCDIVIDDYIKYLSNFDDFVVKIMHKSFINYDSPIEGIPLLEWKEIKDYIKGGNIWEDFQVKKLKNSKI